MAVEVAGFRRFLRGLRRHFGGARLARHAAGPEFFPRDVVFGRAVLFADRARHRVFSQNYWAAAKSVASKRTRWSALSLVSKSASAGWIEASARHAAST